MSPSCKELSSCPRSALIHRRIISRFRNADCGSFPGFSTKFQILIKSLEPQKSSPFLRSSIFFSRGWSFFSCPARLSKIFTNPTYASRFSEKCRASISRFLVLKWVRDALTTVATKPMKAATTPNRVLPSAPSQADTSNTVSVTPTMERTIQILVLLTRLINRIETILLRTAVLVNYAFTAASFCFWSTQQSASRHRP